MKIWTVVANTGQRADMKCGIERKEIQKPKMMTVQEFHAWLFPDAQLDEGTLDAVFKE